jgi:hypothetical protein
MTMDSTDTPALAAQPAQAWAGYEPLGISVVQDPPVFDVAEAPLHEACENTRATRAELARITSSATKAKPARVAKAASWVNAQAQRVVDAGPGVILTGFMLFLALVTAAFMVPTFISLCQELFAH